jgi:predicted negative regulator of RcsB-dependent stress response
MPEQIVKDNRQDQKPISQDYLLEFAVFLKTYWLAMVAGLAVALAAVLGWSFYSARRQQQQTHAVAMLAVAQTPAQFEEIINQHPDSSAAALALLSLAGQQHAAGQYDQAEASYNRFLAAHGDHPWVAVAQLGLIQCQEGRGSFDEAAARYDAFARMRPDDFLAPQALLGKARCLHALNRLADARAAYENLIVSSETNSLWRRQAESFLALVERDARAQALPAAPIPAAQP